MHSANKTSIVEAVFLPLPLPFRDVHGIMKPLFFSKRLLLLCFCPFLVLPLGILVSLEHLPPAFQSSLSSTFFPRASAFSLFGKYWVSSSLQFLRPPCHLISMSEELVASLCACVCVGAHVCVWALLPEGESDTSGTLWVLGNNVLHCQ